MSFRQALIKKVAEAIAEARSHAETQSYEDWARAAIEAYEDMKEPPVYTDIELRVLHEAVSQCEVTPDRTSDWLSALGRWYDISLGEARS